MRALLVHWPHIVPVLLGFGTVVYLWVANRRWRLDGLHSLADPSADRGVVGREESGPRAAGAGRVSSLASISPVRAVRPPVRREAARRGAIVLGPILAAIATGVVIYGIELTAAQPGRGLVWIHVGVSLLVCLLAVYKLADIDLARVRHLWRTGRALELVASALLGALLVPLLLSGILVLVSPSPASYFAYAHLIASAWWTLLVGWHLSRYLARSVGTLRSNRRHPAAPDHPRVANSTE
jgi:hypothetical protein